MSSRKPASKSAAIKKTLDKKALKATKGGDSKTSGKVVVHDMQVTKTVDSSSPSLL